jgi:hypothetical protein
MRLGIAYVSLVAVVLVLNILLPRSLAFWVVEGLATALLLVGLARIIYCAGKKAGQRDASRRTPS